VTIVHFLQGRRSDKRSITAENQDITLHVGQFLFCCQHGMTSPQLLFLCDKVDREIPEYLPDVFLLMTDNDNGPGWTKREYSLNDMMDHRRVEHLMQDLCLA
jgi:hypothetical protein